MQRRHPCAGSIWTAEIDARGVGRAAFCGARARGPHRLRRVRETGLLVDRLREDLFTHRGRRSLRWVWLSPGADAFVPAARDLIEPTLACARALLEHGVGVVLRTRGGGPSGRGLVELAREFQGRLRVDVGFFSSEVPLVRDWESGCAPLGARLGLAESLLLAGAEVRARIGPIIPLINDELRPWVRLMRDLVRHGVCQVSPYWIEDSPGLLKQIEREVSRSRSRMVQGWLQMEGGPRGIGPRQIPEHVRHHGLGRLREAADITGASLVLCACATHQSKGACLSGPPMAAVAPRQTQLDLFAQSA